VNFLKVETNERKPSNSTSVNFADFCNHNYSSQKIRHFNIVYVEVEMVLIINEN
jgi:hypothetical protein